MPREIGERIGIVNGIRGFGLCAVLDRKTKQMIGRCGVQPVPAADGPDGLEGEAVWLFAKEHWGRGYGTEFGNAIDKLDEAIELNPDEGEFYAWRGYAKYFAIQDKKKAKQEAKAEKKASKSGDEDKPRRKLFVLDFDGDMKASSVENMRQEISALLTIAGENDEVLVRLESGGGTVHGYGLGASQLQRIRDRNIPLTVSVDKVAASGGYMMACVGNRIISAPFAIIGSIGVLAQIPNFHRVLEKNDVDFEQLYAGEYKRTLTLFGENTDKGRAKMQEDLEDTHRLFKEYVKARRPSLDIDKVATGEHWLGTRALELGLVDALQTSDDYLMSAREDADIIHLEYTEKQNIMEKLSSMMSLNVWNRHRELRDMEKPLLM